MCVVFVSFGDERRTEGLNFWTLILWMLRLTWMCLNILFVPRSKHTVAYTGQWVKVIYFFWCNSPQRTMASSFTWFLDHKQRRTTVGKAPLDEWSARRRDLYLATQNIHNRHPCPRLWFEPTISEDEQPQNYALDRAATETGKCTCSSPNFSHRVYSYVLCEPRVLTSWNNVNLSIFIMSMKRSLWGRYCALKWNFDDFVTKFYFSLYEFLLYVSGHKNKSWRHDHYRLSL